MQENFGRLSKLHYDFRVAEPTSKTTPSGLQMNASIQVYAKEKITLVGTAYFPSLREIA